MNDKIVNLLYAYKAIFLVNEDWLLLNDFWFNLHWLIRIYKYNREFDRFFIHYKLSDTIRVLLQENYVKFLNNSKSPG